MHLFLEKAMYLTSLNRQDLAWSPWRSSFCKGSSPQQCNVFGAGSAVVCSLRWKAASECENRVFILINIFIERKLSPGSICLLILIYPVSLSGFCTGKETVQPLDRDDRARREGWFFHCMWASVLEAATKLCDDYTYSILYPVDVCRSSTRETGEDIYLENVYDR